MTCLFSWRLLQFHHQWSHWRRAEPTTLFPLSALLTFKSAHACRLLFAPPFPRPHQPRCPPRAACPASPVLHLLSRISSWAPPPSAATSPQEPHDECPPRDAAPEPPRHRAAVSHFHLFFKAQSQNFNNFTLALTFSTRRRVKSTNPVRWAVPQWDAHGHRLSRLCKSTGNLAMLAMVQEQKMTSFHPRGILQSQRNLSFFYFLIHYFAISPFIRK